MKNLKMILAVSAMAIWTVPFASAGIIGVANYDWSLFPNRTHGRRKDDLRRQHYRIQFDRT